jgi:hypothetical protein
MSVAAAEASSGTLRDQTYVPDAVDELAPVLSLLEKCDPEAQYSWQGRGRVSGSSCRSMFRRCWCRWCGPWPPAKRGR